MKKVVFLGLGYIGLPTAAVAAAHGFEVIGVDVNPSVVETINQGKIHIVEPELGQVVRDVVQSGKLRAVCKPEAADAFFIVVPTPFKQNHRADITYVEAATRSVIPYLQEGNLFVIESTSPVYTTERMAEVIYKERPELKGKIHIAYCPERVLPGNTLYELVHNDRVIGGIDPASTEKAIEFYSAFVQGKLHGTNARTAQSYHGNLYLDEYFWIPKFQELRKVASGMAIHKKWRQTYFSTPSSLTHSAYPFWSGALFNRGRNKADKVDIDLSHSNLAPGLLCADGQYRQIVTVEDAVRGGCNLFDLDQLRMEYSPDEYQNLLMCEFVDDLASVFPLSELQACMVDSWEVWTDFHALALRPFGWREVWIGYDPAKGTQNGDSAGCVVVAPPAVPGGKFRILERHQWRGMDFRAQADAIKKLTEQYNVTYIGIDSTGVGHGVYENVKAFFPAVREFVYNPNVKNALVLKAYDIISHRRLEFDAGHTDIAQSFMAIRRATTASGNRPTYEASRSEEASHADLAWATMHALFNEPLQGESANTSNIVEIF
mgnify:CR=1 FL=1